MSNTLKFGNGEWYGKEGTILAYNSENNNYKPLPFTFDRDSVATRVNKQGLIETVGADQPRIDYLNDSNGALLLEPSRTNLVTYSEDFSDSSWIKNSTGTGTNPTLDFGYISPDGSVNATKITFNIGAGSLAADLCIFKTNISAINGVATIYLKGNTGGEDISFLAGNTRENIILTNSWKRYTLSNTSLSQLVLRLRGDQSTNKSCTIYVWGAQVEANSYATSYIPTQGSAVTRVADSCTNENLNVDYSGDYTLYLEHETFSLTEYNQFQFRQETSISYIFRVGNLINIGTNLYTTANTIGFNKFALSVTSSGSYNFYKNGVLLSSGSGLNANLETIKNDALGMSVKEIKLYNTALTDQELAALTQV